MPLGMRLWSPPVAFPGMMLVALALDERLAAAFPTLPELGKGPVEAELPVKFRVGARGRALVPGKFEFGGQRISRVEFEPVHAEGLHQRVKALFEPSGGPGVGEVQEHAVPVPPLFQKGFAVLPTEHVTPREKFTTEDAVGADIRADPQHQFEAHLVKRVRHAFRVGEALAVEGPITVIVHPVVVDHEDAGGEPLGEDLPGVLEHFLLARLVFHLDPGIVLGGGKGERIGNAPGKGEPLGAGGAVGPRQVAPGVA